MLSFESIWYGARFEFKYFGDFCTNPTLLCLINLFQSEIGRKRLHRYSPCGPYCVLG